MDIVPQNSVPPHLAKLSVIFSFYNEEMNLPEALVRLPKVLDEQIALKYLGDYELIFVNDNSSDRSLAILSRAAEKNPRVKVVNMSRNFGHDECAMAGMEMSTGHLCVYLDADLQDPPEVIPEMLTVWREKNADVVHTIRTSREGEGFLKLLVAKIGYKILMKLSKVPLDYNCGDFKLISRRALNEILRFKERNPFMRGIATYVGFKQEKLFYVRKPRHAGETKMPFLSYRVLTYFLDSALISFSDAPLKLVSLAGFVVSFFSFCLAVYAFVVKFTGGAVPGWSGIMIVSLFLGGLQLIALGIVGLYTNSIFLEVKRRPRYVVESTLNIKAIADQTEEMNFKYSNKSV